MEMGKLAHIKVFFVPITCKYLVSKQFTVIMLYFVLKLQKTMKILRKFSLSGSLGLLKSVGNYIEIPMSNHRDLRSPLTLEMPNAFLAPEMKRGDTVLPDLWLSALPLTGNRRGIYGCSKN